MIKLFLSRHFVFVILIAFSMIFTAFSSNASSKNQQPTALQKKLLSRALMLAGKNQLTNALKVLDSKALQNNKELNSEINLQKARIYFNFKKYKKSLEHYQMISKNSEHWLSSVEERAWVKIYLGQMNEAIADSHTLMSPLFRDVVSPEAFHLSAFTAHQVCDFTRVFKVIEDFKKISAVKIKEIEKQITSKRDLKKSWELKHYSNVISQLHLIEADAIQRLYLDKKLAGDRSAIGHVSAENKYDLQFPYEEEDVWIDEVDQLKVDAKNCPVPFTKVVSL